MRQASAIVALLAGVVLLAMLFSPGRDSKMPSTLSRDTLKSESYWEGRVAVVGGAEAYKEFSEAVKVLGIADRHRHAHVFGVALYAGEGLNGLSVCDTQFSYGCFHEFLGRAIAEHGLESMITLNERCFETLIESPLSCQHGIGHGALAYLGYEEKNLLHALDVCEQLPYNDPIGGCYGGVFMEYNLQTMLAEDGRIREFRDDSQDWCGSLPEAYRVACVYWEPQWLHQALFSGSASLDSYTRMGEYCRAVGTQPKLLRACMEGLGTITAHASDYEPQRAVEFCNTAGANAKERLFCTALAANSFSIDVDVRNAEHVCAELEGTEKRYCLAYARNEANILNVLVEP